jgi:glucokinase
MNTLAMDIGGTKFTLAAFEGARMVRRESRLTDVEGGRDWMLAQLREISSAWQAELEFHFCGIGFGGPVDFAAQRVALSTHVGGWQRVIRLGTGRARHFL